MTLVEKGTHPRWTGGFVADPKCKCGHVKSQHGSFGDVPLCWHTTERRTAVAQVVEVRHCRCKGWRPR